MYTIMSSANSEFYFFLSHLGAFSFSCLIALARTSNTLLKKSGKSEHSWLIHGIRGKAFNFSPLSMMVTLDLSYMAFIMLRYSYHKWMLNYIKCFFCIYWDNYLIFILHSVNVYQLHWFADVEPSLHPWNKSQLIMVYDPFNVLLNLVC